MALGRWGGAQGTASDISIHAKEILKLKDDLNKIKLNPGQLEDEIRILLNQINDLNLNLIEKQNLLIEINKG